MITIYWHCFGRTASDEGEKFVAGTLNQLAQYLRREPFKLAMSIKRLGDEPKLAEKISAKLELFSKQSYTFDDCASDITNIFAGFSLTGETCVAKLLVYCLSDSRIAEAGQSGNASAVRGAACAPFAAVYKPNNKNTICHEALHLLGLDDCYIKDKPYQKKPDCNLDGCIMEYAPAENVCENWPFLCDKNLLILDDLGN